MSTPFKVATKMELNLVHLTVTAWFSALMLFTRPIYLIIYGLTLSMMTFIYALVLLVILLILLINIQPYKKSSVRYPSTDTTLFILLALFFAAILGLDLSALESAIYGMILLNIICVISACVPLFYITFFVFSWLINQDKEKEQSLISFISL